LRRLLETLLPEQGEVADFEVEHDFPKLGKRTLLVNARVISGDDGRPDLLLIAKEDITERKDAQRHKDMLVGELSHRVKNSLAVVQSLATQTLRNSASLDGFGTAFVGRLQALARAHDMVLESGFKQIGLGTIVGQALKPFQIDGQIRIGKGPAAELGQAASQALTLMLHELATNAVKYGALSQESGKVAIDWRVAADGGDKRVALTWAESGGPAIASPPGRPGQGVRFIERIVRYELRGEASLDFAAEGLRATIDFPLRKADNESYSPTAPKGKK
jgi:two-component system CheB/CheR fusion protein